MFVILLRTTHKIELTNNPNAYIGNDVKVLTVPEAVRRCPMLRNCITNIRRLGMWGELDCPPWAAVALARRS